MVTVTATRLTSEKYDEYEALTRQVRYGVNLHPLWIAAYLHAFDYFERHAILEARDARNGTLVGMLPLVRKDNRETRFLTQRRFVPAGYGPTDFFGIAAAADVRADVARAIAKWFAASRSEWDQVMVDLIPVDGGDAARAFAGELASAGLRVDVESDRNYLTLDCRGSFDDYLHQLGGEKQKELRYYRNRLAKRGGALTVEHVRTGLAERFDDFVKLYTFRRTSKRQSDPYTRVRQLEAFVRTMIPPYEERGWITLSLLKLDEQVVAYCYCLEYGGVLYYYMPTFRQAFKDCAPGKLLLVALIERAFTTPAIAEFNFMRSEYAYKHWFNPTPSPYLTVTVDNLRSPHMKAVRAVQKMRRALGRLPAMK
jgi:CelD/BcsL family acetyltransferase involved in cellulose biosynthesis